MEASVSERIRESVNKAFDRVNADEARDWNDIFLFEVPDGDGALVRVRNGVATIATGQAGAAADCCLRGDEDELVGFLDGGSSLQTAWMRGDIEVEGDFAAGHRLYSYLRSAKEGSNGATA
jgi:hypothetical protein